MSPDAATDSAEAQTAVPFEQDEVPEEDILRVPNLRDSLEARPSPFCANNNRGGGCVPAQRVLDCMLHCSTSTRAAWPPK